MNMNHSTQPPDIELGCIHIADPTFGRRRTWISSKFQRLSTFIKLLFIRKSYENYCPGFYNYQIEDEPKGYPQFSSLMAAHESFQIFRRFAALRTRMLLVVQDRITQLESRLRDIDRAEARPVFLASSRRDMNDERSKVLVDLCDALKEYDEMLERNNRILNIGIAQPEDIKSLLNWNANTGSITRDETEFLRHSQDLLCFSTRGDSLLEWLERRILCRILKLSKKGRSMVSRNPHVNIYSRQYVSMLTRAIVIPLLITLLVTPIGVCNAYESLNARLAIIVFATSIFLIALALFTNGKALDLAVAGATYTTVLVVFISPN